MVLNSVLISLPLTFFLGWAAGGVVPSTGAMCALGSLLNLLVLPHLSASGDTDGTSLLLSGFNVVTCTRHSEQS